MQCWNFRERVAGFSNLAHWKADHDCKDLSRARVSIHGHYFRSRLALKLSFGAFESWGRQLSHAPNDGLRANLDLKLCPKLWQKIDQMSRSPRASTHLIFLSRQFGTSRQRKLDSLFWKKWFVHLPQLEASDASHRRRILAWGPGLKLLTKNPSLELWPRGPDGELLRMSEWLVFSKFGTQKGISACNLHMDSCTRSIYQMYTTNRALHMAILM